VQITFELAGLPPATLAAMLPPLLTNACAFLRQNPDTPRLYESGVRYQPEAWGHELWKDVPSTLRDGEGDCEDLASWLAAERRVRDGLDARLLIRGRRDRRGRRVYHILVAILKGGRVVRVEDPSRRLGMIPIS
jgi:hypothetical protein